MKKYKLFFILGLIILTACVIKIYLKSSKDYKSLQDKYYQISAYTAQLETQYINNDEFEKSIDKEFNDTKEILYDHKNLIIEPSFYLPNKVRINKAFDFHNEKYKFHEIHLNDSDDPNQLGPPIGYVMIKKNGQIVSKIYKHEIIIDSVVSKDSKTEKIQVISKGYFKLLQSGLANRHDSTKKDWKNIKYPIQIINGKVLINSDNNFSTKHLIFNPKGDLGISIFSPISKPHVMFAPNIGVSLMSYGKSKNDTLFRFIRVGVGIDNNKKFYANVSPVMLNIGYKTNFFSNTYIYPNFGYSFKNKFNAGFGLSLSF